MAFDEIDARFTLKVLDWNSVGARLTSLPQWPLAWLPVLEDNSRGVALFDASAIIEYVDVFYLGSGNLVPFNPLTAWEQRRHDRFFDFCVLAPVQTMLSHQVGASEEASSRLSLAQAQLRAALDIVDRDMASKVWATGAAFGLADCAAAPALWYANSVMPFEHSHRNATAYLNRLRRRPSFHRAIEAVQPELEALPA